MNPVLFGPIAGLAVVALAAPAAAKPGAPGFDEGAPREGYRTDSIAVCTRDLEPAPGAGLDEIEALCSCAADRLMADRRASALPEIDTLAGMPAAMRLGLHRCIGEMQPAAAGALIAQSMRPPNLALPATVSAPPAAAPDKPVPAEPAPARSSPGERSAAVLAWLDGTGLPRWAWAPLLLLVLAFLRLLFRRGDRHDDLMGPPRAMRPGQRPRR